MTEIEKNRRLVIKDERIVCPNCRRRTSQSVRMDTEAKNLPLWCKGCKTVHIIDIAGGVCTLV